MVITSVTSFVSKSRPHAGNKANKATPPHSRRLGGRAVLCALTALLVVGSGLSGAAASAAPAASLFRPIVVAHSGKCLDVIVASQDDGAQVQQWSCHGGANQQWVLAPDGNGFVEVIVQHSGRCLDVRAASQDDGAAVQQWTCHGGANQKWTVINVVGDWFRLVAAHSGKCLDVIVASPMNGATLQQWTCHGGGNQTWTRA